MKKAASMYELPVPAYYKPATWD